MASSATNSVVQCDNDEATKPKLSSRLSQQYKSLETEANSFLDTKTHTYTSRARGYEPTLEELSKVSFSDYVRSTILQCDPFQKEQEEEDVKDAPRKMHTRNRGIRPPKNRSTADKYRNFQPPTCWSDGMGKVTLPKGWWDYAGVGKDTTGRGPSWQSSTKLGDLEVRSPIKQCVSGIGGVYEYTLLDQPSTTLAAFREKADEYRKRQVGKVVEDDMDDDTCDALARRFWKRLGPTMEAPQYGADMEGSLFEGQEASGWNVEQLESCLQLLAPAKGERLPGVTSPYLYVGMWGSVFCAHTEDMNLLSINYLHAGAPKYWYAINPQHSKRFESLMESNFGHSAQSCGEFLRHKRNIISPAILIKAGIPYTTQIQRPGDAMITFPGAYHFGFNTGFNVAESTNFAVPEWIHKGLEAKVCMCHPLSVRIDMEDFQSLLQRYEVDVRRARRVGYRQLSYSEWIDREYEKQEQGMSDDSDNQKTEGVKRKEDGFVVEVFRPLANQRKGKSSANGRKKPESEEAEDWRFARKMIRRCVAPQTKVLCFVVDDEDANHNERCFAGVISEVVDGHVRIHFSGMKRDEDIWMPSDSPKLFLDGGARNAEQIALVPKKRSRR